MGLVSAEVVGDLKIVDVLSGESVERPGTVVLDDEKTRVDVLVTAGLIGEPAPYAEPKPSGKAPKIDVRAGE